MAVIALVMMRSFMYEGSRPVVMFTFMLVLCIITRSLKARVAAPVYLEGCMVQFYSIFYNRKKALQILVQPK